MAASIRHPFYNTEEHEEEKGQGTELICCGCFEPLKIGEDVVLLQCALPFIHEGTVMFQILLDDYGEPEIEPLFYKYECWENAAQELAEAVSDTPPLEEPGAALVCDYCNSSVRIGEKCITAHLGEVVPSDRLEDSVTFLPADETPYIICLTCARVYIDLEDVEIWDFLSQNGECSICTKAHCWRVGRCFCKCHAVTR